MKSFSKLPPLFVTTFSYRHYWKQWDCYRNRYCQNTLFSKWDHIIDEDEDTNDNDGLVRVSVYEYVGVKYYHGML